MNDQQKFTVSYGRDPSMDLPEADAAAEFAQCLEDLRKVDPSIPPMPEGDTSDPLSPASRWWCEHFRLPLLAEDFNGGDKHAFWKALTLIAEHQTPPPAWLASAMIKEFSEKATAKSEDGRGERITPERAEEAKQEYEARTADRKKRLDDGMAEVERLKQQGFHRKAAAFKQKIDADDKCKATMLEIAEKDMKTSLATLKKLLKLAKDRKTQRDTLTDRLP